MNTVITINLGGNAYQIDEAGYAKLRHYLDDAKLALEGNPDQAEIVSDLEAAIGEKCALALSGGKTVVEEKDIEAILAEMGPVDSNVGGGEESENSQNDKRSYKRLYKIREGAMIFGVCQGIAAYFNIDVALVRLIFVLLAFVTSGGFILAYFIMAAILPVANTPEEHAAAYGSMPITAQQVVNRAREGYSNMKNSTQWKEWKQNLHSMHDDHKRQVRMQKEMRKARAKMQRQMYDYSYHRPGVLGELFGLLVIGFCLWLGYHYVPLVHDFLNAIPYYLDVTIQWIKSEFGR